MNRATIASLLCSASLLVTSLAWSGCVDGEDEVFEAVRKLAAAEFNCPYDVVGVNFHGTSMLDEELEYYIAYGCGYQSVYECDGTSCSKVDQPIP